jgi:hypothetical protein
MAEGMTARTIDLNSDEMKAVIRNELVLILSPSEPPGEVQKRACDRLTEIVHAARTPYVPSTTPVRLELGLVTKMKPGDDYKTSFSGFTKPRASPRRSSAGRRDQRLIFLKDQTVCRYPSLSVR